MFQSEFIALMGSPNSGKSTLINIIVGSKIAIVSKKAQTTRDRITGILTGEDFQMVFQDTPGIHTPKNKLGEFMVKTADQTAKDVDVVLFVVDVKVGARERDRNTLDRLPKEIPVVIALNKVDAVNAERVLEVKESLEGYRYPMYEISALLGTGVPELLAKLKEYLQEGPMFYPEDMVTDQSRSKLAAELVREKALKSIGKEIPHGIGVGVEKFQLDETKSIFHIDVVIYTEKDSHKGIIIGAGGKKLKQIASAARIDMEEMLQAKVFLQVWVKVKPDWRNHQGVLRELGYSDQ